MGEEGKTERKGEGRGVQIEELKMEEKFRME